MTSETAPRYVFDGVEIPSTNTDSRGPFYGHPCYLDAVVDHISRHLPLEPVEIDLIGDKILVIAKGWSALRNHHLNTLATEFGLPVGWAIREWMYGLDPDFEPKDERDGLRRPQGLYLWFDRKLALAGSADTIPKRTHHTIESGKRHFESEMRGEY